MELTVETKHGKVTLRGAMLEEADHTTLTDGIEISIDGELKEEVFGITFGEVEEFTVEEIEAFVEKYVEYI